MHRDDIGTALLFQVEKSIMRWHLIDRYVEFIFKMNAMRCQKRHDLVLSFHIIYMR